jgi:hypothetical protein
MESRRIEPVFIFEWVPILKCRENPGYLVPKVSDSLKTFDNLLQHLQTLRES